MIVGNGLIGCELKKSRNLNGLFFCSGVSSSLETRDSEYERELNLLSEYLFYSGPKFYFSSLVQIDPNSKYISKYNYHKSRIESILINHTEWFIIRLPQIVGNGGNKMNLFNFFKNKISNNETIVLNPNSIRSLLDVSDVPLILDNLTENQKIYNIISPCTINVVDLYKKMSYKLNKVPKVTLEISNDPYSSIFHDSKNKMNVFPENIDSNSYLEQILNKYL